jgi:AcrR family transcriptional regulator
MTLPRTRPANRRAMILAAASALIADRGYENVALGDIAAAVGVRPSALYRHFANKEAVLAAAVGDYLTRFGEHLADLDSAVDFVLSDRPRGLLWAREARHLPVPDYRRLREELLARVDALAVGSAGGIGHRRLRSVALLAVLTGVSLHRIEGPGTRAELRAIGARVVGVRLPDGAAAAPARPATGMARTGKREQVLGAAISLFAERTYDRVGIDDIATAVDLAPSSVYNHFAGKHEILATALHRGNGFVQVAMDDVLRTATGPADALAGLVESYSGYAVRHPELVAMIVSEARSLAAGDATIIRQAQRSYIEDWVHLYRMVHPGVAEPVARLAVQAALGVINDLARAPETARLADPFAVVMAFGSAAL